MSEPTKMYQLVEIFCSIKGEGVNTGIPMMFIRFAGCNLNCPYCDTPNEVKLELTEKAILARIASRTPSWIVFTGGEPGLQLTNSLVEGAREASPGVQLALESNGTVWNDAFVKLDYKVISPKLGYPLALGWKEYLAEGGSLEELRYIITDAQSTLWDLAGIEQYTRYITISPIFHGGRGDIHGTPDPIAVERCVHLAWLYRKSNVRVSVQVHKLIGVR